jgi:hypothetical protein
MTVVTFEGVVDGGQIKLKTDLHLPDNTRVYVVVPDVQVEGIARVYSPKLRTPGDAADFRLEVVEEGSDASV